ncbi:MAG TPA: AsmA family protein [Caulobacteraceae bacterium]|nr:AsmA family protein [Caulobacteraceae bacterium]
MATVIHRVPRSFGWTLGISSLLILALALFLAWFNWDMLRGPIAREASARTGRAVRIDGHLAVHLWSWTPTATLGGLKIGNPAWMGGGDVADIDRLVVSVKALPLLFGQVELPLVAAEHPTLSLYRDQAGRENWRFGASAQPLRLPPIQHLAIDDGHLTLFDKKRGLTVVGIMQSSESGGGGGAFHLVGHGTIRRAPFLVTVTGAGLINVRRDRPYPFDADIRAGDTRVLAHGELPKPFDFGQIRSGLTVSGPNFADLYDLTGLALPPTPPYRLSGELVRNGTSYAFQKVSGRVGGTDLDGVFRLDREPDDRPDLHADLSSHRADIADLGSLIGAPTSGAEKSAAQQADAARLKSEDRLLPDAQLLVGRVRAMDAVARYRAASVRAGKLPVRGFALDLTLDHGVLTADPVSFSLPRGDVTAQVRIDARGEVPVTDLDGRIVNLRIEDFLHAPGPPAIEGVVEARARLRGAGGSVRQTASNANGDVTVVAPHGEIRQSLAELMGVNVVKGLDLYLSNSQAQTRVRCAVADFHASGGMLSARALVLDTDPVLATGKGSVNLRTEAINVILQGHPKRFQLIRLNAPVTIGGKLRTPKVGVDAGKAVPQIVAAVALGVFLSPAAAILPFVDLGLTKKADCAGLVARAQEKGAPIKAAAAAARR